MIVYRDLLTGDEMLSDAYPLKEVVDAEGNKVRLRLCYWGSEMPLNWIIYCYCRASGLF
jgi:hypothetical protein